MKIVKRDHIGPYEIATIFEKYIGIGSWQIAFDKNGSYKCKNLNKVPVKYRHLITLVILTRIREFIKENSHQIEQLYVLGDTKKKRQNYKILLERVKEKYPKSSVYHSDNYSRIVFETEGELKHKIDLIKTRNLQTIKSLNKRG